MKQAAIFDLDGVIVDTARFHYLAWKRLAAELGFQFTEAQNERLKGVSRMQSLEYLLDSGGLQNRFSQEEKEKMAARKNRWYGELIATLTEKDLLPGAERLLKELKLREWPLCWDPRARMPRRFEEPWNTGAVRRRGGWKYGSGGQAGSSGVYLGSRAGGNPL